MTLSGGHGNASTCILLVVVLLTLSGQAVAVSPATSLSVGPDSQQRGIALTDVQGQEDVTETNNSSTPQHENPDTVTEDGDTAATKAWLAHHLSAQLENSTINLSQGEYARGESLVGDQFEQQLDRYVDVAGETETKSDDQTAEQLAKLKQNQTEYASAVQRYRQTRAKYRRAQQTGNETRARKLARELERLQQEINQTGATITQQYETLGNRTETNLTAAQHAITTVTQNITTQQAHIRNATFVQTRVTITTASQNASFRSPVRLTGRLTAANGTRLADRQLIVTLGPQQRSIRTNATGHFTATVRPTRVARGDQNVTVAYVPKNSSIYLGSQTRAPVTVSNVTPTMTLTYTTPTAAFSGTVTVTGRVHVADVGVANVPVRIGIGTTVIGTVRTDANGSFQLARTLPATVAPGDRQLHVWLPLTDQALTATTTTRPLTVTETATQLTLSRSNDTHTTRVAGTLTTATQTPLANQTIQLRIANHTTKTVTTNATGDFVVAVNRSAIGANTTAATVNITAVYPGAGNLAPTRAVVSLSLPETQQPFGWLPIAPWLLAIGVLGLGLGVGGLAVARSTILGHQPDDDGGPATPPSQQADTTHSAPREPRHHSQSLLGQATAQLADDQPAAAVQTAYTAVRQTLRADLPVDATQADAWTHWEFYQQYRESMAETDADTDAEALLHLTEAYERAQFTTETLSVADATTAVDSAQALLTSESQPERATSDTPQ